MTKAIEKGWLCFHCDEFFADETLARDHFGPNEDSKPACQIKAGAEGSLVKALRRAEGELADAWNAIHDESTEAAKAYFSQQTRHREQLTAAEELGYERGLADGRASASDNMERMERALVDLNDAARAACQVADRDGKDTNWLSLRGQLHYTLAEHHEITNEARAAIAQNRSGE